MSIKLTRGPCKVCNVETAQRTNCGVKGVCFACKRFFIRHRRQKELLKCDEIPELCSLSSFKQINNVQVRNFCPRCRLDRCFKVGMQGDIREKHRKMKANSGTAQDLSIRRPSSTIGSISSNDGLCSPLARPSVTTLDENAQQMLFFYYYFLQMQQVQ